MRHLQQSNFSVFVRKILINPWFFIPHTTHLCQLLDAEAFLSLKHCFKMANSEVVAWGGSNEKRDFSAILMPSDTAPQNPELFYPHLNLLVSGH